MIVLLRSMISARQADQIRSVFLNLFNFLIMISVLDSGLMLIVCTT